jgi:phosphoglycolate phosphatase-like HAD superfamily hydrolase
MAAPLRALVLDFDGVILESNEVKTEVFREIFARFPEHAEAMMEFHRANAWKSRYVKFDHLVQERLGLPADDPLRDRLAADFSRLTHERLLTTPFVGGAEAFLAEFAPRVPLYVASVTPQEDIDRTVDERGLRPFLRDVYGCPPWTKAGAIRDVLAREGLPGDQVALIGDASGDRAAAAEAGVEFIWRESAIRFDDPPAVGHSDMIGVAGYVRGRLATAPSADPPT